MLALGIAIHLTAILIEGQGTCTCPSAAKVPAEVQFIKFYNPLTNRRKYM